MSAYEVASVCFVEMDYFVTGDAVGVPCVVVAVSASDILVVDFVYLSLPVFERFFLGHNKRTDPQRKNPKQKPMGAYLSNHSIGFFKNSRILSLFLFVKTQYILLKTLLETFLKKC